MYHCLFHGGKQETKNKLSMTVLALWVDYPWAEHPQGWGYGGNLGYTILHTIH